MNANIDTPKSLLPCLPKRQTSGRQSRSRDLTTEYDEGAVGGQTDTERLPRFSVQTAICLNRRGVAYRSEEAFRAERAPIRQRVVKPEPCARRWVQRQRRDPTIGGFRTDHRSARDALSLLPLKGERDLNFCFSKGKYLLLSAPRSQCAGELATVTVTLSCSTDRAVRL